MKIYIKEYYWPNGQLEYCYHETEDNQYHGLEEAYNEDGSIEHIRYWYMDKPAKLGNYYLDDIEIDYFI